MLKINITEEYCTETIVYH